MDIFDRAQVLEAKQRQLAISRAGSPQAAGPSHQYCVECGEEIPEQRRQAIPGVALCRPCQEEKERMR